MSDTPLGTTAEGMAGTSSPARRPTTLLAELTYRCPLHCPYCSNPIDMAQAAVELTTDEWGRVFDEARALGVLQLGLSGGEPLLRTDVVELTARARHAGLYTTLVTSGLGLTRARAAALKAAGLDHVQISFQDADRESAETIAGVASWERKHQAAAIVRELGFAFTVNAVLHRANLDRVGEIITLAASLGADRLELANTQYYGWAAANRDALMPTREQLARAEPVVDAAMAHYRGTMQIVYVLPDYYQDLPKPCMGGWGSVYLVVAPDGRVLPCQAAWQIETMTFSSVRDHSLGWIWEESPAFQAFRGDAWMKEPCRSCPRKQVDFGGCRCQAFLLTGDAANADPVCALSPFHVLVERARSDEAAVVRGAPSSVDSRAAPGGPSSAPVYRYRTVGAARRRA